MSDIGTLLDRESNRDDMHRYFERLERLKSRNISARALVMIQNLIDLRRACWQPRRTLEGDDRDKQKK
jgi:hypothetical protein